MRSGYWQELLEYTRPHKAAVTQPLDMSSRPWRRHYDAMGMLGSARFAANLAYHMTPAQGTWFLMTPQAGSEAAMDRGYADSLAGQSERLHESLRQGNFETEVQSVYEDWAEGTACLAVRKDPETAFSLSARPIREYAFLENHKGRVDTVFVRHDWTAYEAAQRFGMAKLPQPLQDSLKEMKTQAYAERKPYLNVVKPNAEWDPAAITARRFPMTSLWIDKENAKLLESGGVRRQRYIVSRFWKPTGVTWGVGPSDMAYSWVRAKDKAVEVLLKYAAKVMDPPSVWPDDGAFHPRSTAPGTIIKGRMSALSNGQPQYMQLQGNHQIAQWLLEYLDAVIMQAYFADVFRVLTEDRQKTAYEVATVLQKDFAMVAPIVGRAKWELFGPLLRVCLELQTEYELGVMGWRYGGQDLPEYGYDLELISPLGLAVRYAELQKMSDLIVLQSQLAQVDPGVWQNYSLDEMSRAIGEHMGVPRRWLRSVTERQAIRVRIAELQEQQMAAAQANVEADTMQKLSGKVDPSSALAAMAA